MTDGLDQALAQVPFTLLAADPLSPALVVYDGVVPNPTPAGPYVLVYTFVSRPSDDPDNSADNRSRVWVARWFTHSVGESASAARAIAQRVRTQLLDVRPVIAGLSCGFIRMEVAQPPVRDEKTGTLLMDQIDIYLLRATS